MKKTPQFIAFWLLAGLSVSSAFAADREWDYQISGTSPASGTQRPTSGKNKAELMQEKDGSYTFRIRGNTAPSCYMSAEPAQVEETDTTITVTPTPRFTNCERIRLVIRKDGSGGIQQALAGKKANQAWADEEMQTYGLTAR